MPNEDGSVWVSYNGEIYNFLELRSRLLGLGHEFKSTSDTEVLVHGYEEWGVDLPEYLRGMFAFAVYDQRPAADVCGGIENSGRLLLARDHFGIKPLYYALVDGTLFFASEMKALLVHPGLSRELDRFALDQYLSFLYVPEPRTICKAIRALPPAHTLTLANGELEIKRYWEFNDRVDPNLSDETAIQAIQEVMEESVQGMMVADVPIGVFLSGGLDSTSILAMMVRQTREPVQTFSIGFDSEARNWDELEAAKRIATRFETEHHEFRVEPNVIRLLPNIIRQFDQPFANPTAIILYLLAEETRHHVKVALAGTGGDEMFAGYPRYQGILYYLRYRHFPLWMRRVAVALARGCLRDSTDGRPWRQRVRRFLEGGTLSFGDCYVSFLSALDRQQKQKLYRPEFIEGFDSSENTGFIRSYLESTNGVPETERIMGADLNTYLPFNQLAYGDRMSMAHALEVRVPFVDQQVVDVAGKIPLRQKLAGGITKGLFRKAMTPLLPKEIIEAPKRGLNLPIALWFRTDLRDWVRSVLAPERLAERGYFKPKTVATLLDEHESGWQDHSLFLWALVVLEEWHRMYVDQ
jgi:asparagine synthase (glutamine-hydrolysing)